MERHEAHAAGLKLYNTGKPCKRGHLADRYVVNGGCTKCVNLSTAGIPRDGLKWNQVMAPTPMAFPYTDESKVTAEMVGWVWAHRVLPQLAGWMDEYWRDVAPTERRRTHSTREEARSAQQAARSPTSAMLAVAAVNGADARVTLTAKAGAASLGVMLGAGWTPETLVAEGYATWKT